MNDKDNIKIWDKALDFRAILSEWRHYRLPLMAFFCGLVLSSVAFFSLNVSVKDVLRDRLESDYERMSRDTAEEIVQYFQSTQRSLDAVSSIVKLLKDNGRAVKASDIQKASQDVNMFEEIAWCYKQEDGSWAFTILHDKDGDPQSLPSFVRDRSLVTEIRNQGLIDKTKTSMLVSFSPVASSSEGMKPLVFSKTLQAGDEKQGVMLAITQGNLVALANGLKHSGVYKRISLYPVDRNASFTLLDNRTDKAKIHFSLDRSYEFDMGGTRWDVVLESDKEVEESFLTSIPVIVLLLGLGLSVVGALYIYNGQKQASLYAKINKKLEDKNEALEKEIAERARLNEALETSERNNRAIIDAVSDIIFEMNAKGEIVFLSARWRKVTGFDLEQSTGRDFFSLLHPEDQDMQRKDFEAFLNGQRGAYRSFARIRTADGTFRAIELAISVIRQGEDNEQRIVGSFTDVEERRRAERALSEAEKKYRAIVENAAGGIYQLTPEGLYLSANPAFARILGYDGPDEILREIKNANTMIYADQKTRMDFIGRLEKERVINNHETQMLLKDGSKIWVNENVRVVYDEHGHVLYYEGSVEDITKRKESELALREAKLHSDMANRAKSEFLANMSHELRTPLNAIIGFSEIIKDEMFGPVGEGSYLEYAGDIYKSGKGLLEIINEILDIAKIDAGERQLNESVVDLNKVLDKTLSLLSNKITTHNIVISNNAKDVPQIIGEELAIKQVCMNLITNAIKFTPSGGSLNVSFETTPNKDLVLSFTDTGIGMTEEEVKTALLPFSQLDTELSREGSGTGLGLTLVKALMQLHGGRLEIFSQKGVGTTASVIFPAERVTVKKSNKIEAAEVKDAAEQGGNKEEA